MGRKTKQIYSRETRRLSIAVTHSDDLEQREDSQSTVANVSPTPAAFQSNQGCQDVLAEPGVIDCVDIDPDIVLLAGNKAPLPDESTIPQQGDFSFHLSEEFDDIPEVSCTGTDVECSANEASEPPVTKSPDAHNGGDTSLGSASPNLRAAEEATALAPGNLQSTIPISSEFQNIKERSSAKSCARTSNVSLTSNPAQKSFAADNSRNLIHSDSDNDVCRNYNKNESLFKKHTVRRTQRNTPHVIRQTDKEVGSISSSDESIAHNLDSEDSYHPPVRGKKRGQFSDSESSDNSNGEASSQIHTSGMLHSEADGPQKKRHKSNVKVVHEKTITADDVLRPELSNRWSGIKKQLDFVLAESRKVYVIHSEGHPDASNLERCKQMSQVSKELKQYSDHFNDLATSLENLTEKYDMDCFLNQEAEEEEQVKRLASNTNENEITSDVDQRDEVLAKLHADRYKQNQIQRESDAQVKGTFQVVRTKEGNTKKIYKCDVCGESLSSRRMLDDHLQRHTGSILQCSKCSLKIKSRLRMKEHLDYHIHGPWICLVCKKAGKEKKYIWRSSYLNHMRLHNRATSLKCKVCQKVLTNEKDYRDHVKNKHTPGKFIKCRLCEQLCKTELALRAHLTLKHKKRDSKGQRI